MREQKTIMIVVVLRLMNREREQSVCPQVVLLDQSSVRSKMFTCLLAHATIISACNVKITACEGSPHNASSYMR